MLYILTGPINTACYQIIIHEFPIHSVNNQNKCCVYIDDIYCYSTPLHDLMSPNSVENGQFPHQCISNSLCVYLSLEQSESQLLCLPSFPLPWSHPLHLTVPQPSSSSCRRCHPGRPPTRLECHGSCCCSAL